MTNNEKETFEFTYSAKEQAEIKRIREKYLPEEKTENKLEQLKKLDESVTKKATSVSLVIGIIGVLILGSGMSLVMTDLAENLGEFIKNHNMFIGIVLGVAGIILAGIAHPVYNRIVKKERKKIAPQIISLTDDLMK
ncbi:MAG: hypothetical protein E7556_02020 [Ruminococcaceae bacterium]|nr:hypothetical protein [Oscillospiraceae bacterium]